MPRNPSKRKCKAWKSDRSRKCNAWAMRGKEVCRVHGGKTPGGLESPHLKHGRYSKYMRESLAEIVEQLREEVDLESIDEEILIATALFVSQIQLSGEDWLEYAKDLLVAIVSFKEKRHRMLYGEKVSITYAEAEAFVVTVINVINKEVADPATKQRIYKGIGVPDAILARAGIGTPGAG